MIGDLYVTDGTTRINLLTGIDGFYLDDWNPSVPPAKDTWRDSPLSDGRKLAMSKWANAIETFRFKVARFTQDDVIYETQELRRLLEAAKQYFFGGSDVPVWLEARGNCETNTRYAVVCNYSTGSDTNPYQLPFDMDRPVMTPWTLVVERQHWRDKAPGLSTCVELSATQDYYDEQMDDFLSLIPADDAWVDNLNIYTLAVGDVFGADGAGLAQNAGMRFNNVTIPKNAYIVKAYISMKARASLATDNVNILIACEDVDDSAAFTTRANFNGRARTATTTAWNAVAHFVIGTSYTSPSFVSSVQTVVNRAGWASNNHLTVFFDNNVSTANAYRDICSFDEGNPAILYIWWFDATTRTFGRTATCMNEVYVANKHNIAQLTHIYVDDGGVFGANLVGAGLPFAFLPAVTAVNDAVYFGVSTLVPNSGPFCSLVFDIGIAQVAINTLDWQYYDSVAGAWHALDVRDNTNANGAMTGLPFDTTGVNSVHWDQPSGAVHNWGTTTINGVLGYWVRALVGAVGNPPTQQNRDIYTIVTPYVDTLAAQVPGDITALAELLLEGQSGQGAPKPILYGQSILYAGLRSYNRGANFTSFINLSSEQNTTGIVVTVNGGTATFVDDVAMPSGRAIDWTTGALAAETWLTHITIPTTLVDDFAGKFRCFFRLSTISAVATDLLIRLVISSGLYTNSIYQTAQFVPVGSARKEIIDFGSITLPPILNDVGNTYKNIFLRIDGQARAAVHAHFCDLILLPIDECFMESRSVAPLGSSTIDQAAELAYMSSESKTLCINSTIPRRMITTDARGMIYGIWSPWANKTNSPVIWQSNVRQRWWFFQQNSLDVRQHYSDIYNSLSLQAWKVSRYLSMRGKR